MPWRLKPSITELVNRELSRRKLSVRALSRLTGIHHSRLSRWLNGDRDLLGNDLSTVLARLGFKVRPPGK